MQIYLVISLLFLKSTESSNNLIINLTDLDSSYALNGNLVKNYERVTISIGGNQILAYSMSQFKNQNDTNFILADSTTTAFHSTTLSFWETYHGDITISFDANNNFDFVLIFRRFLQNEGMIITNTDFLLYAFEPQMKQTFMISAEPARIAVCSIVAPLDQEFPNLSLEVLQSDGVTECLVSLYAGGPPSDLGAQKYKLYDFEQSTYATFVPTNIRTFAMTFLIPSECGIIVHLADNSDPIETRLVPGNHGFLMSFAYLQMDVLMSSMKMTVDILETNSTAPDLVNQTFHVNVVGFDPIVENRTSLLISFQNQDYTLTKVATNANYTNISPMAFIRFNPLAEGSDFLLRYRIGPVDETTTTTTTMTTTFGPTTSKVSHRSQSFLLSILLMILIYAHWNK